LKGKEEGEGGGVSSQGGRKARPFLESPKIPFSPLRGACFQGEKKTHAPGKKKMPAEKNQHQAPLLRKKKNRAGMRTILPLPYEKIWATKWVTPPEYSTSVKGPLKTNERAKRKLESTSGIRQRGCLTLTLLKKQAQNRRGKKEGKGSQEGRDLLS